MVVTSRPIGIDAMTPATPPAIPAPRARWVIEPYRPQGCVALEGRRVGGAAFVVRDEHAPLSQHRMSPGRPSRSTTDASSPGCRSAEGLLAAGRRLPQEQVGWELLMQRLSPP